MFAKENLFLIYFYPGRRLSNWNENCVGKCRIGQLHLGNTVDQNGCRLTIICIDCLFRFTICQHGDHSILIYNLNLHNMNNLWTKWYKLLKFFKVSVILLYAVDLNHTTSIQDWKKSPHNIKSPCRYDISNIKDNQVSKTVSSLFLVAKSGV